MSEYNSIYRGEEIDAAVSWVQNQTVPGTGGISEQSDIGAFVRGHAISYSGYTISEWHPSVRGGYYATVAIGEGKNIIRISGLLEGEPIAVDWTMNSPGDIMVYSSKSWGSPLQLTVWYQEEVAI